MQREAVNILVGDVMDGLATLPAASVHCCVTSPPYWRLRDYGVDGQIGLESTPDAFVEKMVAVFREVRRVLREDGTLWLNLGDCYASSPPGCKNGGVSQSSTLHGVAGISATYRDTLRQSVGQKRNTVVGGLKPKDLCMMPWRVAMALQADGWWIRSVIVWAKKSTMPESVTDRPTSSWEPIFLMSKSERYFYDAEAVKESSKTEPHAPGYVNGKAYAVGPMDRGGHSQREQPDRVWGGTGRNMRNVWHLGPEPFKMNGESVHWNPVEADAVGGDIRRTPSADCPIHGCLDSRRYGEHGACSTNHSLDTDDRPDQEPRPALQATEEPHDHLNPACDSDSYVPPCSLPATSRNNQSRKTDHAPSTIQPCTPCVQTGTDTLGTEVSRESSALCHGMHANKSSVDGGPSASGSCPSEQKRIHNENMCTCQYHRRVTKKIDHFATYPTEIPRRAIKAGTSEKGCCPACGAPWRRLVERTQIKRECPNELTKRSGEEGTGNHCANTVAGVDTRTTGWEPTCDCGHETVDPSEVRPFDPIPCTVLDPFLGSGTTVAVARQLGRYGVGCEINPAYAELARERIGKTEKPLTFQSGRVVDSPLFAEGT